MKGSKNFGRVKKNSIQFGPGSKYYMTDLTVTSGSKSEPEDESDKV